VATASVQDAPLAHVAQHPQQHRVQQMAPAEVPVRLHRVQDARPCITRLALVSAIVDRVKATHPYEVPGISARPIIDGNPDYLQ
jgi:hypothetical protein